MTCEEKYNHVKSIVFAARHRLNYFIGSEDPDSTKWLLVQDEKEPDKYLSGARELDEHIGVRAFVYKETQKTGIRVDYKYDTESHNIDQAQIDLLKQETGFEPYEIRTFWKQFWTIAKDYDFDPADSKEKLADILNEFAKDAEKAKLVLEKKSE